MQNYTDLSNIKIEVESIIQNKSLTYEQTTSNLAKLAENLLPFPVDEETGLFDLYQKGIICDLFEGHAPYAPRYILPDYQKLLNEGCSFLRLKPASNLLEAINSLLIFYKHVPSVTRFPVYIGSIDTLLNPYIDSTENSKDLLRFFLNHIDRTISDSFCHANIGPKETLAGNLIVELLSELQNVTPNLTLLYDNNLTSDQFSLKCIESSLNCANPAFANDSFYTKDFPNGYGIASCYNALPLKGGAFTLSRLRLNKIAQNSKSLQDFFDIHLPHAVKTLCNFMESKIDFLVDKTPFFEGNFLALEKFIDLDNFTALFGIVGLHECVNELMKLNCTNYTFGKDVEADDLGIQILEEITTQLKMFKSKHCKISDNRFLLHAQVGAAGDIGTTAGARIAIGAEPHIYDHLRHSGKFHRFFPSGVGDHFPFEYAAKDNLNAVLDIFKGGFKCGMRYISAYPKDGDFIRVTGYLIKKSDLNKFSSGQQVQYDTVQYAQNAIEQYGVLDRKVHTFL